MKSTKPRAGGRPARRPCSGRPRRRLVSAFREHPHRDEAAGRVVPVTLAAECGRRASCSAELASRPLGLEPDDPPGRDGSRAPRVMSITLRHRVRRRRPAAPTNTVTPAACSGAGRPCTSRRDPLRRSTSALRAARRQRTNSAFACGLRSWRTSESRNPETVGDAWSRRHPTDDAEREGEEHRDERHVELQR